MRLALFCALGALHTCLAFRPWTRPAWEGVAIVKQVTSAEPSPACLEEMGRSHLIGGVFEKLQLGVDCVIVCSSHKADPLTVQFDSRKISRNTVVAHVLSFTKALLEEFDTSGEEYKPVGKGSYDCGKLARYLKDVLEGALAAPVFAGNDKEVFEFLQGLSRTDKETLWRTARWYNYLVELTLAEDEE